MPRRFKCSYTQAGYTAAEFGEPIQNNYFAADDKRALFERGHRAFAGDTFSKQTAALKAKAKAARMMKSGGKGLKKSRPVADW